MSAFSIVWEASKRKEKEKKAETRLFPVFFYLKVSLEKLESKAQAAEKALWQARKAVVDAIREEEERQKAEAEREIESLKEQVRAWVRALEVIYNHIIYKI